MAFGSFDEIRDVGYVFGKNYFESMAKAGRLGRFNQWFNKEPPKKDNHASLSEYTFIDLAQIVCKLPDLDHPFHSDHHHQNYFYSEDEDYDGYISEPSIYNRVSVFFIIIHCYTFFYATVIFVITRRGARDPAYI